MGMIQYNALLGWMGDINQSCGPTAVETLPAEEMLNTFTCDRDGVPMIGNPVMASGMFKSGILDIKCGGAYLVYSNLAGATPYEIPHLTPTSLNEDLGRMESNFDESIDVSNLTGDYSTGNGKYNLSTKFKNGKPIFTNENGWDLYWDPNTGSWVIVDGIIGGTKELKNDDGDPGSGYWDCPDGCGQAGKGPSTQPGSDQVELKVRYKYTNNGWQTTKNNELTTLVTKPAGTQTIEINAITSQNAQNYLKVKDIEISLPNPAGGNSWQAIPTFTTRIENDGTGVNSTNQVYCSFEIPPISESGEFVALPGKPVASNVSGSPTVDVTPSFTWTEPSGNPTEYQVKYDNNIVATKIPHVAGQLVWTPPGVGEPLGSHTFQVCAFNATGQGPWSDVVTVVIEAAAPTATITGLPAGDIYPKTNFQLDIGGTDVVAYKFKWNDGAWSSEKSIDVIDGITVGGVITFGDPGQAMVVHDIEQQVGTNTLYVVGKNSDGIWQTELDATTLQIVVIEYMCGPENYPEASRLGIAATNVTISGFTISVVYFGTFKFNPDEYPTQDIDKAYKVFDPNGTLLVTMTSGNSPIPSNPASVYFDDIVSGACLSGQFAWDASANAYIANLDRFSS